MKSIGWRVAEVFTLGSDIGDRRPDIGHRTRKWFYILSSAALQCIGQTTK